MRKGRMGETRMTVMPTAIIITSANDSIVMSQVVRSA